MNDATTTLPPMPATDCPSWCPRDHAEDWARHAAFLSRGHVMPLADGTTDYLPPRSDAELVERWAPLHLRRLATVEVEGRQGAIDVQQDADDDGPVLYLDVREGAITSEQARRIAHALLEAADTFDQLTA